MSAETSARSAKAISVPWSRVGRVAALVILFAIGLAIWPYDLDDPPLDFHAPC